MSLKSFAIRYSLLLAAVAGMTVFASCTESGNRSQTDHEAIVARQLVVEQFGSDVWESDTAYNTFFARCPDGSVWLVTYDRYQPASRWTTEKPTRISAKTMIFDSLVKIPAEEP